MFSRHLDVQTGVVRVRQKRTFKDEGQMQPIPKKRWPRFLHPSIDL